MRIFGDAALPGERFGDFITENFFLLLLIVGVVAAITAVLVVLLKRK